MRGFSWGKRSVRAGVGILLICTVGLSGCTQGTSSTESVHQAATSLPKEELVLAVGTEPEGGFDPTTGWGQYGSPLFQSTLLKRDAKLQLVNDLATDHSVSKDGLTWTVTLRDHVKFSDGEPLTAEDVRFTFETAAKSGSVIDLTNMANVEAPDATTVVFTLKSPQSTFISLLTTLGIVPEHAYGPDYAEHPVGSGPYKLVQWDKGQQAIVEANEQYYGKKSTFHKLTFLYLDEDAAFAAAQAGTVDIAAIPAAFSKQQVNGMKLESVKTVDNRGIMFPMQPAGAKSGDGLPAGNDVTSDISIRKAVNLAIDRTALVEGVLEGQGRPAYSVSDDLPWSNPDSVFADANPDEAKQILADGGWADTDGDGIVEKNGTKAEFNLIYFAGDLTRQSLALAAADMVAQAGIKVNVEGKSREETKKLAYTNAVLFGWGSHDPLETYNLYSSTHKGEGYYNTGLYSNPIVDNWMQQALQATTEEEALPFWQKAEWDGSTGFSYQGDAPWAWLVNIDHLYLVKNGLNIGEQQIHPHGHGWPVTFNLEEWSWDEDSK
ncbi:MULTISPECIES: ABC transporter substrate-binding protein [unclassified Paenibacillus]|uniref:ABC transporter substrate-binding protein n=1 Tax=unclassified Paenibacillus TaxID=185978 RepID=UPI0009A7D54A|nr:MULTISPECIES: ABC transporter substrate-binding protein [unclassified Paenibacillus]SLK02355.1 peptide/nickel transport system substrate-binding protein [Paenibacillus sp. RU5A]SOC68930.1 peptide/nickel transport system substrate-binding protein [Paenibacillus sp. RU26A]SOC71377.1 peptide/nickel transport system substrate-binding protein [Paenibacillus sp. RU5M]